MTESTTAAFFVGFGIGFLSASILGFFMLLSYFLRLYKEGQEEIYGNETENDSSPDPEKG
tara:strand:+ start:178 stop:357 length:180 start_codon:yes stop_codon:yes gene_type:complete